MMDVGKILVVDDDPALTSVITQYLEGQGHAVEAVHSGGEARTALAAHSVDVLLLDLRLPDVDGIQLMRETQRLTPTPDVVIVTGHATLDSAIAAVELGAAGYVEKPVDLRRLGVFVGRSLERRRLLRDNAAMIEKIERERQRAEALNEVSRRLAAVHQVGEVLSLIVNEASRLLGAEASGLRLRDGDDLIVGARTESAAPLMARARLKLGESLSGIVVATGEAVAVEDLAADTRYDVAHREGALRLGFRGFIGVPLRARGHVVGTLNVYTKGARHFRPDEVSLLSALADQAALAIEKAGLLRETQAREREATQFYAVTRELASSLDADRVLEVIVDNTVELLSSDAAGVYLYDESRAGLVFRRGLHLPAELTQRLVLQPGEGVAGRAFSERRPVWTTDRLADPTLRYSPAAAALVAARRARAYLAVPIGVRGETFGVLVSYSFTPREFTAKEIQILSSLADHAGIAVDNARLFTETETQRRRFAQIFASTSDGILLVGRDGRVQAANRRAGELLDFDAAQAVGGGLAEMLPGHRSGVRDPERALAGLRAVLEDPDREGEGDLDLPRLGSTVHWVARPTADAAGATIGLTLTLQDVTQEREVSRMKSDFVSFVTHQLRTPLAGIRWMLELAAEGSLTDEVASYVHDASGATARLIRLVNDMLDIARLESGRLATESAPLDLGALTQSVLDDVAALIGEKGHRVAVSAERDLPQVEGDPQLLRQVVLNLVSNAIKYTPPGGDIAIDLSADGAGLRWRIRDTGIGIPKESQRRLFEKFYRAENAPTLETEGTGLGLYLVKLIVERHGGRIWCESEEGRGSTFSFTVPK